MSEHHLVFRAAFYILYRQLWTSTCSCNIKAGPVSQHTMLTIKLRIYFTCHIFSIPIRLRECERTNYELNLLTRICSTWGRRRRKLNFCFGKGECWIMNGLHDEMIVTLKNSQIMKQHRVIWVSISVNMGATNTVDVNKLRKSLISHLVV